MERLSRTEPEEWRIIEALYGSLRRLWPPTDLEPGDLLHEALVLVLRRRSLSGLDAPVASVRKTIPDAGRPHNRGRGLGPCWPRHTARDGDRPGSPVNTGHCQLPCARGVGASPARSPLAATVYVAGYCTGSSTLTETRWPCSKSGVGPNRDRRLVPPFSTTVTS